MNRNVYAKLYALQNYLLSCKIKKRLPTEKEKNNMKKKLVPLVLIASIAGLASCEFDLGNLNNLVSGFLSANSISADFDLSILEDYIYGDFVEVTDDKETVISDFAKKSALLEDKSSMLTGTTISASNYLKEDAEEEETETTSEIETSTNVEESSEIVSDSEGTTTYKAKSNSRYYLSKQSMIEGKYYSDAGIVDQNGCFEFVFTRFNDNQNADETNSAFVEDEEAYIDYYHIEGSLAVDDKTEDVDAYHAFAVNPGFSSYDAEGFSKENEVHYFGELTEEEAKAQAEISQVFTTENGHIKIVVDSSDEDTVDFESRIYNPEGYLIGIETDDGSNHVSKLVYYDEFEPEELDTEPFMEDFGDSEADDQMNLYIDAFEKEFMTFE